MRVAQAALQQPIADKSPLADAPLRAAAPAPADDQHRVGAGSGMQPVDAPLRGRATVPRQDAHCSSSGAGAQYLSSDGEAFPERDGGFALNPDEWEDKENIPVGQIGIKATAGGQKGGVAKGWQLPALSEVARSAPPVPRSPLQTLQLSSLQQTGARVRVPALLQPRRPAPLIVGGGSALADMRSPARGQSESNTSGQNEILARGQDENVCSAPEEMVSPAAVGGARQAYGQPAGFSAVGLSSPMSPGSPSPEKASGLRATGMRAQQAALAELGQRSRLRPALSLDHSGGGGGGGGTTEAMLLAEDRGSGSAASQELHLVEDRAAAGGAAVEATLFNTPERAGVAGSPPASSPEPGCCTADPAPQTEPLSEGYLGDDGPFSRHVHGRAHRTHGGWGDKGEAPPSGLLGAEEQGPLQTQAPLVQKQAAPSLLELASMHTSELQF